MMRASFLIALSAVTSVSALADELTILDGWARETPPGKRMTAAYGTIMNVGDDPIVITGVSSEVAAHSSFHETRIERDRSIMRPVANMSIAPGAQVELNPGGMHIMLMKLEAPLVEGELIDICFKLENNEDSCSAIHVAKRKPAGHSH